MLKKKVIALGVLAEPSASRPVLLPTHCEPISVRLVYGQSTTIGACLASAHIRISRTVETLQVTQFLNVTV